MFVLVRGGVMPERRTYSFEDPYPYQAAIRAANMEVLVTARGDFRAELTQIDLPRLWMQRGQENLPRIFHGAVSTSRAAIGFLTAANQPAIYHCGAVVRPGDIIVNDSLPMHRRTEAGCQWGAMSLRPDDLAAAGIAISGRELTVPSHAHIVRPTPPHMSRLLSLHEQAGQIARHSPDIFAHPEAARALEQALVHAMIECLTDHLPVEDQVRTDTHMAIMARLEEFLAANQDQPVYLAEICAATGASERTLRICCKEYLGMGPIQYLWLRRMHMAHRALINAPASASVTEIATDCGFWELGRFSVEYRALFGEPPSLTLRQPPDNRPASQESPFRLASEEFA
jgi:AraC-like DNA-binding protein